MMLPISFPGRGPLCALLCFLFSLSVAFAAAEGMAPAAPGKKQIAPAMGCPRDFVLEGNDCVKTSYEDPIMNCPPGFKPEDSPDSQNYQSRSQRRRSNYSSTTKKGYEPRRKKEVDCVRLVTAPPTPFCPSGFEGSSSFGDNVCEKFEAVLSESYCSSGFTKKSDGCYRSTVHDPSFECGDPTFTMVGNECQRIIEMRPMEGCPQGHMLQGDRCVKVERQSPFEVCPEGTIPLDGRCVSRVVLPARPSCQGDFELIDGMCVKETSFKPPHECEEGSVAVGDECIIEQILGAELRCEDGFKMEDGDCVMRRPPIGSCPNGGTFNPDIESCETFEALLPAVECPRGFELVNDDTCLKLEKKQPNFDCSPGFELFGENCIRETASVPEKQCPDTYLFVDEVCMRPTYSPKWQKCQNGFNLGADRCTATEAVAADMICPEGFTLTLNKCVEERRLDVNHRCPDGAETHGRECVFVTTVPSQEKCEEPYLLNKKTGMCEDQEVAPPDLNCPKGFTYKGDCVRVEKKAPIQKCPDNHYYDDYYQNCKPNKRYVPAPVVQHIPAAPVKTTHSSHGKKSGSGGFDYKPVISASHGPSFSYGTSLRHNSHSYHNNEHSDWAY